MSKKKADTQVVPQPPQRDPLYEVRVTLIDVVICRALANQYGAATLALLFSEMAESEKA